MKKTCNDTLETATKFTWKIMRSRYWVSPMFSSSSKPGKIIVTGDSKFPRKIWENLENLYCRRMTTDNNEVDNVDLCRKRHFSTP